MYLNKAIIIGNLTRDPELKSLPSGMAVASMSIATNRTWKDKSGAKKEDVEFHNVVIFGKTAENVARYMKKGSNILVEGRIQTRSWDDKQSGEKRYRTEIIGETVQFGFSPKKDMRSDDEKSEASVGAGEALEAMDGGDPNIF
jgi:single-strand DNA-binding protein